MSLVFEEAELFWFPRLGSSLALLLITFFYGYQQWSHFDWRLFAEDTVVKKLLGNYLDCFASFFFSRPSVFRAWRSVSISVFSASGSKEWLPKLLLVFLVFRKRKAVLNWSWAVAMWSLALGKESWKYSPAFWFKRARCVRLCWGCFACPEQVLESRCWKMTVVDEHPGLVLFPFLVLLSHIATQIYVMQIRLQIVHSVAFMTAEFPLFFNVIAFSIFVVSEERVIGAHITSDSGPQPARTQISW